MFDMIKEGNKMKQWIARACEDSNKVIIDANGSVESSVIATMCVKAVGKANVILVNVSYGAESSAADAVSLQSYLRTDIIQANSRPAVDSILFTTSERNNTATKRGMVWAGDIKKQLVEDVRRTTVMAVTREHKGILCNTLSLSQTYLDGLTQINSGINEIFPAIGFTHGELIQLGMILEMPESLLLLNNSTEFEHKHNIKFNILDDYIRQIPCGISPKAIEKIEDTHRKTGELLSNNIMLLNTYLPTGSEMF